MSAEKSPVNLDDLPLPTNRGELKELIAATLAEVLAIPTNAAAIAKVVTSATVNALAQQEQNELRKQTRLCVTPAYYQGSWRCSVVEKKADDESQNAFSVEFEEEIEGVWQPVKDLAADRAAKLSQLVLSTNCTLGDTWYLTTNAQIDAALEAASERAMQQMAELNAGQVQH